MTFERNNWVCRPLLIQCPYGLRSTKNSQKRWSWKSFRSQTSRSISREGRNQRENHIQECVFPMSKLDKIAIGKMHPLWVFGMQSRNRIGKSGQMTHILFTRKWHHVINFEWTSCSISWMQSNIGYLFFIDHIVYFICSSFHEIEQDRHSKFITWCQILGNCINCIRNMRHFSIFPIWFTGVVRI